MLDSAIDKLVASLAISPSVYPDMLIGRLKLGNKAVAPYLQDGMITKLKHAFLQTQVKNEEALSA